MTHPTNSAAVAAALALAVLVAGLVALVTWRHQALGVERNLSWNGTGWQLREPDRNTDLDSLDLQMDLGSAVLLRARTPAGRTVWLPFERGDAPTCWHGLRVAVAAAPASASSIQSEVTA